MILLALLYAGFKPIREASKKDLLFNIRQIQSNFFEMKQRAKQLKLELANKKIESEYVLSELKNQYWYDSNVSEIDRNKGLKEFVDRLNKTQVAKLASQKFNLEFLLTISWFSAALSQIDEVLLGTPVSREVLFQRIFKLTSKQVDLLLDGNEIDISNVINLDKVHLFLKFPKSKDVYYLFLKVGNQKIESLCIEESFSRVVSECVRNNDIERGTSEVLTGNVVSKCAVALAAAMSDVFALWMRDLFINSRIEQLTPSIIEEWDDKDANESKGDKSQSPSR